MFDGAGMANRRYVVAAADWESVGGAWMPMIGQSPVLQSRSPWWQSRTKTGSQSLPESPPKLPRNPSGNYGALPSPGKLRRCSLLSEI